MSKVDSCLRQKNIVFDLFEQIDHVLFERTPKFRVTGNCVTRVICRCYLLISVPISLCRRFSFATTNLLNRSVFSISVSDVDSNFSLRLEDSEEGENDEWWVVLQVSNL